MATEKQIEANRRNGALGGPKTEAGKARSRLNATKHGLAGESADVEAAMSPEFQKRRAEWAEEQNLVGKAGHWAMDRAVAASLRVERCERTIDVLCEKEKERARLIWDEDRAIEAATIFGRLAKDPLLASCQLQATLAGTALLIEAWLKLASALASGVDWSESEASKALDLLGVAADLRSGRTPIDDPEGGDPVTFRRSLALDEYERLETLRDEALIPLDQMDQRHAMAGDVALLSARAKLILRYERDAWKHYRDSMKEVKTLAEAEDAPAPPPPPVPAPSRRAVAVDDTVRVSAEEVRALRADAAPIVAAVTDQLRSMGLHDEDAWLDELERRIEAMPVRRGPLAPERTQIGGVAIKQGP
jgi:hypothetical protein